MEMLCLVTKSLWKLVIFCWKGLGFNKESMHNDHTNEIKEDR